MTNCFPTVLLLALPASGKSEVRKLLRHMDPARMHADFHMGASLQLDDFPYVHMMRRIDEELSALGSHRLFYPGEEPFFDGRDWGTLCMLLNEDYDDLINRHVAQVDSAARLLLDRIDRAAMAVGLPMRLGCLPASVRASLEKALEAEAMDMLRAKHAQYPDTFENRTIIIECARGGPDKSPMPLTGTFGYQYSLSQLSPAILRNASILYIEVTPEESRRKNEERAHPDDPGSDLHHGVPMAVMLGDYGCDDMAYLRSVSPKPNTVQVQAHGATYYLPIGVFDNRQDKTSFLREESENWDPQAVAEVSAALRQATDAMASAR